MLQSCHTCVINQSVNQSITTQCYLHQHSVVEAEYGEFVLPSSGHSQKLQQHKLRDDVTGV